MLSRKNSDYDLQDEVELKRSNSTRSVTTGTVSASPYGLFSRSSSTRDSADPLKCSPSNFEDLNDAMGSEFQRRVQSKRGLTFQAIGTMAPPSTPREPTEALKLPAIAPRSATATPSKLFTMQG